MSELKNDWKDRVTVWVGSWGGDNVYGQVFDKHGVWIKGAKVKIENKSNNDTENDTTNGKGEYDVDVDAEVGHKVHVTVTWKDSNGNEHKIEGDCTLEKKK